MAETVKKISPEDILDIVIRRRWFIIVPLILCLVAGIVEAIVLPKIYMAETLILVEPQRVPTNYVQSIVSQDIDSRISTISQQILSRTNMEKIINEFDLYAGPENAGMYMEDKIASMRSRINVNVTRGRARESADTFSISFRDREPDKVMKIVNTLASYFIDENLKAREAQAIGTSDFLDSELETMRRRLENVEETLKNFRKEYMGELPEQLDSNLRVLDRLQEQMLERQVSLRDAKNRLAALEKPSAEQFLIQNSGGTVVSVPREEDELTRLRAELAELKMRYTERHPDILRLTALIAEREAEELKAAQSQQPAPVRPSRNPAVIRQKSEIINEINKINKEIADQQAEIIVYQKRVENTPKREQELLTLQRDYANIQQSYSSLLNRRLEAEIAVNMEKKQKGEQFRILDPARLPQKPVAPNMQMLFLIFIGAGLGIGGGIVFLLEYLDTSFKKPEDIEETLNLNVLGAVPPILLPREVRAKRINLTLSAASVMVSLVLLAGFAVLTFKGVDQTLAFLKKII
jgi:polysaccharide chain length determinant protein (PEP-CTERM system associated)